MGGQTRTTALSTQDLSSALRSDAVDSCQLFTFGKTAPIQLNPDGHFEFIVQLNGDFRHKTFGNDWVQRPRIFIGGLHNKAFQVSALDGKSQLISLRLKVERARNFLPGSLEQYKNQIVALEDLFSSRQLEPLYRLSEHAEPISVLHFLDQFLERVEQSTGAAPLDHLLREIHRLHGDIRLSEMATFTGLTPSALRRNFAREVGMSPKEYAKIVRFNHVSTTLLENDDRTLTEIAYDLGYYDQAHFIKDVRSITGLSPKHFRSALAG